MSKSKKIHWHVPARYVKSTPEVAGHNSSAACGVAGPPQDRTRTSKIRNLVSCGACKKAMAEVIELEKRTLAIPRFKMVNGKAQQVQALAATPTPAPAHNLGEAELLGVRVDGTCLLHGGERRYLYEFMMDGQTFSVATPVLNGFQPGQKYAILIQEVAP